MSKHFNGLTPAEAERLSLLMEECGEVIQAIGKIMRHGYESTHPDGGSTNREALEGESGHVMLAISLLVECGDLKRHHVWTAEDKKRHSVRKYLHHHEDPTIF